MKENLLENFQNDEVVYMDPRVLGIGSAHVDVFIRVDEEAFEIYALPESRHIERDVFDLMLDLGEKVLPGGCAANTIRGLAHLGVPCAFLSCVGKDRAGRFFLENLKELGIHSEVEVVPGFKTIQLICLIGPTGEKRILYPKQEEPKIEFKKEHFEGIDWVHIDAFQFEIGNDLGKIPEGPKISLNLGNVEIVREYKQKILRFSEDHVDVLFGNEEEVKELTGLAAEEACLELQTKCPLVVMTREAKGCLIASGGKLLEVSGQKAKRVDATGAGDAFASGFIFGMLRRESLQRCGSFGNRLGAAIVEEIGAQLPEKKSAQLLSEFQE